MRHLSILASLVFLVASVQAQVSSYVPTDGLVGWWPFNGNANDESGNGNNGTVNGASLDADRFGNANSSFMFNGMSDYISVEDNDLLDLQNSYTLSAWVNIPDYSTPISNNDSQRTIFGKPRTSDWATGYNLGHDPDGISTQFLSSAANMSCCPNSAVIGSFPPPINTWIHVLSVYNGSNLSLYVNGVLDSSLDVQYTLENSSEPLFIGKEFVSVSNNRYRWFKGLIDDIGIWSRALEPCEVQALYNAGNQGISSTPVNFTGLNDSYSVSDGPATLVGSPAGGTFIGPGVSGNTFNPATAGVGTHSITYTWFDACGSFNTTGLCTTVDQGVGIGGSNLGTGGVLVYPNPNGGQFTLELDLIGLVSLQVYDAGGRLAHSEVFQATGTKTIRNLDLSGKAKGTYSLQVRNDGGVVTQVVVVE